MSFEPGIAHIEARIDGQYPFASVEHAYIHIYALTTKLQRTVNHIRHVSRTIHSFGTFEDEIKLLHKALTLVIIVMGEPVFFYKNLGLRIDEEAWLSPPLSTLAALDELQEIVSQVREMIQFRKTPFSVPDYAALLEEFRRAYRSIHSQAFMDTIFSLRVSIPELSGHLNHGAQTENEEQLHTLDERTATADDESHYCNICVDNIMTGQRIKILPCSHFFHEKCIDTWLRISSVCPTDGARI